MPECHLSVLGVGVGRGIDVCSQLRLIQLAIAVGSTVCAVQLPCQWRGKPKLHRSPLHWPAFESFSLPPPLALPLLTQSNPRSISILMQCKVLMHNGRQQLNINISSSSTNHKQLSIGSCLVCLSVLLCITPPGDQSNGHFIIITLLSSALFNWPLCCPLSVSGSSATVNVLITNTVHSLWMMLRVEITSMLKSWSVSLSAHWAHFPFCCSRLV